MKDFLGKINKHNFTCPCKSLRYTFSVVTVTVEEVQRRIRNFSFQRNSIPVVASFVLTNSSVTLAFHSWRPPAPTAHKPGLSRNPLDLPYFVFPTRGRIIVKTLIDAFVAPTCTSPMTKKFLFLITNDVLSMTKGVRACESRVAEEYLSELLSSNDFASCACIVVGPTDPGVRSREALYPRSNMSIMTGITMASLLNRKYYCRPGLSLIISPHR